MFVTGDGHRLLPTEYLREIGLELGSVLLESVGTNTAPALTLTVTSRFLKRKMEVFEALQAEIEALRSEVEKPGGEGTLKA